MSWAGVCFGGGSKIGSGILAVMMEDLTHQTPPDGYLTAVHGHIYYLDGI